MNELISLLNKKSVFIFDFDGVLVDSVEIKTEAFASLFEGYGPDIVQRVVAHHRSAGGVSRYDKLRYYHREYLGQELTDEELDRRADEFSSLVVERVAGAAEIPGAEDYLQTVQRKKRCFINSATPDAELGAILRLRGWLRYFDGVYGSSGNKEMNLHHILDECGVTSDMCVFFGDAGSDYMAAMSAGIIFIGVNMPKNVSQKLPDALAYNLHSFKELCC